MSNEQTPVTGIIADGVGLTSGSHQGNPVLVMQFLADGQPVAPPVILVETVGFVSSVAEAMEGCLRSALAEAQGLPEEDGVGQPWVMCSGGCGKKLFGERAVAGWCVECEAV